MIARTLLTIAITAAAITGLAANSAAAEGTYQVSTCNAAPGGANHSWTWFDSDTSSPSHYTSYDVCPYTLGGSGGAPDQEHGLSTTDTLGLTNGASPGSSAGWRFTAPANTTITGITYERYLGHQSDPDNYWSPALRAEDTIVGETCLDTVENGETCAVGGPPGKGIKPAEVTGLRAHELSVSILCKALASQQCVTGATQHEVWAAMYGATVTLEDNFAPTLSTPSGSLWEEGQANGYHKGQESLTVEGRDVGGGVRSIILAVDGKPVTTYEASCDFTYTRPCPLSTGPQTLTLDTTALSDGTHTLTLEAVDAAGNHSTIATKQVTVDNTPPAAPVDLTASPTTPGGSTFTVTWSDPRGQVSPIASATYQLCPAGGATCSPPTSAPAAGPVSVTVPGPGSWTLAVWLTDAAGNSSSANAAQITLTMPQPSGSDGGGTKGGAGSGGTGGGGASGGETGSGAKTGGARGGSSSTGGSTGKSGGAGKHVGPKPKARLRIRVRLLGRRLIVYVRGPWRRRVLVGYEARRHGHGVAHRSERVRLRHGRRCVVFKLGAKVAARATIWVDARLDDSPAVRRRLRRRQRGGKHPQRRRRRGTREVRAAGTLVSWST